MSKVSISITKGKGSVRHNNRAFIAENVDKNRIKDNIVYKQESLELAYKNCFEKAVQEYNEKQKRTDRRINGIQGYMNKIKNSGNGEKLFYEIVVQVGNMYDSKVGTSQGKQCQAILDDYMKSFSKRNPNLYVFNAVMHLDEKTPHLHIDYIPIAHGYQKGLQARNSLDRALKEQGIDGKANKKENSTLMWQEKEKDCIEMIMNKLSDLERAEEKGLHRKHKSIEEYKTICEVIENRTKQVTHKIPSKPKIFSKGKELVVKKDDLEALEYRAILSSVHKNSSKILSDKIEQIVEKRYSYEKQAVAKTKEYQENIEKLQTQIQEELSNVKLEKEKYERKYKQQQGLNEKYNILEHKFDENEQICVSQKEQINTLKQEINNLKAEYAQRTDTAVEEAKRLVQKEMNEKYDVLKDKFNNTNKAYIRQKEEINGLKTKHEQELKRAEQCLQKGIADYKEAIESLKCETQDLEERLTGMCQSFTNAIKAFKMLKYDEENGYKITSLNTKQSRLFNAVEKYAQHWLRKEKQEEMAVEVKKDVGISVGINKYVKQLSYEHNR